jgi:dihydrofolate reductase
MTMKNNGIGLNNELPWPKIPKEMKHFADITTSKEPLAFSGAESAFKSCFF